MGSVGNFWISTMHRYLKEKKRGKVIEIAMMSFKLSIDKMNEALEQDLLKHVKEHAMAPYYREICAYFGKTMDEAFYNSLKQTNDKVIREKKEAIAEKKSNGSDDDVLDLILSLVETFLFL